MLLEMRAQGVMIGLALGDALGVISEGLSAGEISRRYGSIKDFNAIGTIDKQIYRADDERTINALQRFITNLPLPGLYSDDTQQALILTDSLLLHGKIDVDHIVAACLKMALYPRQGSLGLFRGAGPGFKTFIDNLWRGKPYNECSIISAGNGAAMRIAPLGIYYHHDLDALEQAVIDASLLTHRDIRGIAAAGLIAFTIAYIVGQDRQVIDHDQLLSELTVLIHSLENRLSLDYPLVVWEDFTVDQVSRSIDMLHSLLDHDHDVAITKLDTWAVTMSKDASCSHNHPFALGSVIFSLYLFVKLGHDPEKAILTAVNDGGDTDTIAAMVGALCGALRGPARFPSAWQEQLVNREQICLRSRALVETNFDFGLLQELFELEKAACKAEDDYRDQYRKTLQEQLGF